MEAGKGFDAIIARQVMGWTKATLHDDVTGPEAYWCMGGKAMAPVDSFTPSTDIAVAWKVVNHLLCHGWDEKYFFRLHYDNVDLWDASFYKESSSDGGGPDVWGTADSAPLAICLAALKAVQP